MARRHDEGDGADARETGLLEEDRVRRRELVERDDGRRDSTMMRPKATSAVVTQTSSSRW